MLNTEEPREVEMPTSDYAIVSRLIEIISEVYRDQPSLEELARQVDMEPQALQRLFSRWAGLTPRDFYKQYLEPCQAVAQRRRALAGCGP